MRAACSRISVLLLLCAFLTLSGCQKPAPKSPLAEHTGNFTTTANITYKDLKAVATISQESPSSCSVVFESPPSLKEMTFVFTRDNVELGYKGLSFSFDPNSLPGGAVANMAVSAINKAMKDDGLSIELGESALEVRGMMDSGEFSLRLDKETGNLIKLSVPAEELEIAFVNFRFLD